MSRKLVMNDVFYATRPIDDFTLQIDKGYYRVIVPEGYDPAVDDLTFIPREDGESRDDYERRKASLERNELYTFHKIDPETGKKTGKILTHNAMVFDFRYMATGVIEKADLPITTFWKIGRTYEQQEMK